MSKHIAVVGSLNVDSVVRTGRFPLPGETVIGESHALHPGGKGGNQAFGAARLTQGQEGAPDIFMLGQVGGDSHAQWLKDNLSNGGVNVSAVGQDPDVSSGLAAITLDANGQNHIVIVPGSNGTFTSERLQPHAALLRDAAVVLLQLEIPLETVSVAARIAHEGGATVILDPAPAQALPDDLLSLCDFVTPNESELRVLSGRQNDGSALDKQAAQAAAEDLRGRGVANVIVKMGGAGALWVGAQSHTWPAFQVTPVDTTAAGDAWNAGFAVGLAGGATIIDAGTLACATAALSVTKAGAQPSMPDRHGVQTLLEERA